MSAKPRVIELDQDEVVSAFDAEPIQTDSVPETAIAAHVLGRRGTWWGRLFWVSLSGLIGLMISIGFWNFIQNLLVTSPWLSLAASVLLGLAAVAALVLCFQELSAFGRLRRIDHIRRDLSRDWSTRERKDASKAVDQIKRLYRGRADMRWSFDRFEDLSEQSLDAPSLVALAETILMDSLDKGALEIMRSSSRRVTAITALVPLALVDVVSALWINISMIRQIAVLYGGRSGTLGSYRLLRGVVSHLAATGAIALTDDLISSVASGGIASKLSRRFGEGIVNGALTLRVGIAAMEVCRPMPFEQLEKPKVRTELKAALTGIFSSSSSQS